MNDMVYHGQRKLTVDQIRAIKAAAKADPPKGFRKQLARAYGVSLSTIQDIIKGRSYAHVD